MSFLPTPPTPPPAAQVITDANKAQNLNVITALRDQVHNNIRACWASGDVTPQEFLDQYGTAAVSAMILNRDAVLLIMAFEQAAGITLLDPAVLALVGEFTPNQDGTVTVTP